MSRIGKKPIALPKGVTIKVEGNTIAVQGPKGKIDTVIPRGIRVEQQDGHIVALPRTIRRRRCTALRARW